MYPDYRKPPEGQKTMKKHTRKYRSALIAFLGLALIPSCAGTGNANSFALSKLRKDEYRVKSVQHGKASWYSIKTNYGTATASGQRLCNNAPTAAHKTLPLGTKVRVINMANNKSEVVTINDRGPYIKGRIIDVTIGTAEKLGFVNTGVVPVKVEVLAKAQEPKG
jgi:rare lipoprotein A